MATVGLIKTCTFIWQSSRKLILLQIPKFIHNKYIRHVDTILRILHYLNVILFSPPPRFWKLKNLPAFLPRLLLLFLRFLPLSLWLVEELLLFVDWFRGLDLEPLERCWERCWTRSLARLELDACCSGLGVWVTSFFLPFPPFLPKAFFSLFKKFPFFFFWFPWLLDDEAGTFMKSSMVDLDWLSRLSEPFSTTSPSLASFFFGSSLWEVLAECSFLFLFLLLTSLSFI